MCPFLQDHSTFQKYRYDVIEGEKVKVVINQVIDIPNSIIKDVVKSFRPFFTDETIVSEISINKQQ
jgi:hypothetical protein